MADVDNPARQLKVIDSLTVDVVTDDVSDTYVSKALFAVSEFANVILAGAKVISGEALLCANLGLGLRLVSKADGISHTMLFDTGPEGTIFLRNCANLGIRLSEVECIAVSHGHWDHMAALPATIDAIRDGGKDSRGPRQSGNVQRTSDQVGERRCRAGRKRALASRNGGARCNGRQPSGSATAARQSLLLQRRDSEVDVL